MNVSIVDSHPGYDRGIGSTHDWDRPAPGVFVWVTYRRLGDGKVERREGFSATKAEAAQEARGDG